MHPHERAPLLLEPCMVRPHGLALQVYPSAQPPQQQSSQIQRSSHGSPNAQVPKSALQLVLELEVDWSGADLQASHVSGPRLCFVKGNTQVTGWTVPALRPYMVVQDLE
jgi:hypothetical protein